MYSELKPIVKSISRQKLSALTFEAICDNNFITNKYFKEETMEYTCPECSNKISFDISKIDLILLKLKCSNCAKVLLINNANTNKLETEEYITNVEKIKDMILIAYADGVFSPEERNAILLKAKEYNIQENIAKQLIEDYSKNIKPDRTVNLVKEYDENMRYYYNSETKFYDIVKFIEKISMISVDNPNLKKYREDLLHMISFNQESWMEKAKFWENIYNSSNLETEWRKAQDHMQKSIEYSNSNQVLYDDVISFNKQKLIEFAIGFSKKDDNDWD